MTANVVMQRPPSSARATRVATVLCFAMMVGLAAAGCARPNQPESGYSNSSVKGSHASASSARAAEPLAESVLSVSIVVSDLGRAIAFYEQVLGFSHLGTVEAAGDGLEQSTGIFAARTRTASLTLGQERIELVQFLAPEGRPIPVDSRSTDRWFQHIAIVVSDIQAAYAHLRAHDIRHASSGPQTLPETIPAAAGISAFYFKDPDGHVLEIIQFPVGKGDARWHEVRAEPKLFLGIDHTAIVVADTQRSIEFYCGVLGLQRVGGSENFGTEQARLNGVHGAHLRITTLRAKSGPGVELLEYLWPAAGESGAGRAYPADSKSNDHWSWRTNLSSVRMDLAEHRLERTRVRLASLPADHITRQADSPSDAAGTPAELSTQPVAFRDPDGHVITLSPSTEHRQPLAHDGSQPNVSRHSCVTPASETHHDRD